ncbi:MAG: T9SS type A sorting domain-containing protein [Ignavibacteria bacterium]|nr:T9SS type A sorting domain-containing protein [Ignavibacteria bacterium]
MKTILILLIIFLTVQISNAQFVKNWQMYPYTGELILSDKTVMDETGNLYTLSSNLSNHTYFLKKVNPSGIVLWSELISPNNLINVIARDVYIKIKNNELYVVYNILDTSYYLDEKKMTDFVIIYSVNLKKFDLNGNLISQQKLPPLNIQPGIIEKISTCFDVDNLGNIIIGGFIQFLPAGFSGEFYEYKYFIQKINSSGIHQWEETFGNSVGEMTQFVTRIECFDNNNIYTAVERYNLNNFRFYRHDQSGIQQSDTVIATSSIQDKFIPFKINNANQIGIQTSSAIVKIMNSNLRTVRNAVLTAPAGYSSSLHKFEFDKDGNIYGAGIAIKSPYSYPSFVKINIATGNVIWKKVFENPLVKTFFVAGSAVDNAGNLYISGQATMRDSLQRRGFVMSCDSSGNFNGLAYHRIMPNIGMNGSVYEYIHPRENSVTLYGLEILPNSQSNKIFIDYKLENIAPSGLTYNKYLHAVEWNNFSSFPESITLQIADKSDPNNFFDLPLDSSGIISPFDSNFTVRTSGNDKLLRFKAKFFKGSDKFSDSVLITRGFFLRHLKNDTMKAFNIFEHSFRNIPNSEIFLWPEIWWEQFAYNDPSKYPQAFFAGMNHFAFPDFHIAAELEGHNKAYISFPDKPNPGFVNVWKTASYNWFGSCFGFSSMAIYNFYGRNKFKQRFSFMNTTNPGEVIIDDSVRRMLNIGQAAQTFGNMKNYNSTLGNPAQIINILSLNYSNPINFYSQVLTIRIPLPDGSIFAHAITPYAFEKISDDIYHLFVYDSNYPLEDDNKIIIDITLNKWKYRDFNNGNFIENGKIHLVGDIRGILDDNEYPDYQSGENSDTLEVFTSGEKSIYFIKENDTLTGYNRLTNNFINPDLSFSPLTDGILRAPQSYFIPYDTFSISIQDQLPGSFNSSIYFKTNEGIYHGFSRADLVNSSQNEFIDVTGNKIIYKNSDGSSKNINLLNFKESLSGETVNGFNTFEIKNINVSGNDSIALANDINGNVIFNNYGNSSFANILLTFTSPSQFEIFNNFSVPVPENSSLLFLPTWDSLSAFPLTALIDSGNTGKFDDTLLISNEPLPVNLLNFNSNVNGNNVLLTWATSFELNNSGFSVQRKNKLIENSEFTDLAFINGVGNSTVPKSYSYIDKNLSPSVYEYRLKQIDYNGNFSYYNLLNEIIISSPVSFALRQNYPNPFNPVTNISFDIPTDEKINLKIFDVTGREVAVLINNELKSAGQHLIKFDASSLSSGVYFYMLTAGNFKETKRMIFVK